MHACLYVPRSRPKRLGWSGRDLAHAFILTQGLCQANQGQGKHRRWDNRGTISDERDRGGAYAIGMTRDW